MPAKIAVRRGVIGRPSQTSGTRSRLSGRVRTARPRRRAVGAARPSVWSTSAPVTSSAASDTSIPDSAPQTSGPATEAITPPASASARLSVHIHTRRRVRSAVASAAAMPSTLAQAGAMPASAKVPASSSVQSGAVDPETGTPGL